MTLTHYVFGLIAIAAANWAAARWASAQVSKLLFLTTAISPMIFWLGLNAWFLLRDGFRSFQDPYFFVLLMMLAGFTVATAITAFLGRDLGRRRRVTQTPR
jgi:hypothetical protein